MNRRRNHTKRVNTARYANTFTGKTKKSTSSDFTKGVVNLLFEDTGIYSTILLSLKSHVLYSGKLPMSVFKIRVLNGCIITSCFALKIVHRELEIPDVTFTSRGTAHIFSSFLFI
jgi:hypothetical protein